MANPIIPKTVLIDTGFWFAIYNRGDQYHKNATSIYQNIQNSQILIPWPTLYEVLNTQFIKDPIVINNFEKLLKKQNVIRLDDSKYKEAALEDIFFKAGSKDWKISLVDSVIRQMLSDVDVKIEYFVTFNEKDFSDILRRRNAIQFYY